MEKVILRSTASLMQVAVAGGHGLVADEPVSDGGDGTGPNPYDLLLTSLGACTAMTLLLYARRKGWPLESVEVELEQERVHAADCQACEQGNASVHRITRQLVLAGPLDEAQRKRLAEIARSCPMYRTLTSPIEIVDQVRFA